VELSLLQDALPEMIRSYEFLCIKPIFDYTNSRHLYIFICTAEQHNSDWWFVRKYLTQEKGLVPAHLLQDEPNYMAHVQKKVHQKIDRLPVFESKYF
jgi:hypothetical protein